jgi:predicted Zn finger-like uncharacterized protein
MLTTRCPNCQTTFRITSAALHKAAGQVRCGQCETLFSAFDSLTDTLTNIPAQATLQSTLTQVPDPAAATEPEPPLPEIPWRPIERAAEPEAPGWRTAALIAAVALLLQGAHHFRHSLAHVPWIGGALDRVYSLAGMPIVAVVDPENFTIVNWVATAQNEASDDTDAALAISAGLRNTSDGPLPYPMLSLELTNRWEETIGARVFTPDEYMGTRVARSARIRPSSTVTAQLQLVDPGPDAYGFEVDICVAVDERRMRCKKADDPFQ